MQDPKITSPVKSNSLSELCTLAKMKLEASANANRLRKLLKLLVLEWGRRRAISDGQMVTRRCRLS
jgi:hypothetical protein